MSNLKSILQTAENLVLAGNVAHAESQLMRYWEQHKADHEISKLIAYKLSDFGCYSRAVEILQHLINAASPSAETLTVIGMIAFRLEKFESAIKFFNLAIQLNPGDGPLYLYLAKALYGNKQGDEAVELLKAALEKFPDFSDMWTFMGILAHEYLSDGPAGKTFYETAVQLDGKNLDALNNLSVFYLNHPDRRKIFDAIFELDPDHHMAHLNLAYQFLKEGNFDEGWAHYAYRDAKNRGVRKSLVHSFDLPLWQGEDIQGKSLFVTAEQGLGDEVLFASVFDGLRKRVGHLYIGCDPRLQSIYQRSFPDCTVVAYEDTFAGLNRIRDYPELKQVLRDKKIDYMVPLASTLQYFWDSYEAMSRLKVGYLKADPSRVDNLAPRIKQDRVKVGVSWRSGRLSTERNKGYPFILNMLPMFEMENVDFYVLQYDIAPEEIEILNEAAAPNVYVFDDIDLKNDLEANLAIMEHMDIVVGPLTATQTLSLSMGKNTLAMSYGMPWWIFGVNDAKQSTLMPHCRVFVRHNANQWLDIVDMCKSVIQDLSTP